MRLRTSEIPSKQLALFLLAQSPELRRTFDQGVDVACNAFHNLRLLRVQKYIGTDIIRPKVDPAKRGVECSFVLSNAVSDPIPSGDLVLCLETIGITSLFDHSRTLDVVKKLGRATNANGTLVLNIGPLSDVDQMESAEDYLRREFRSVRVVTYGRWAKNRAPLISFTLGLIMAMIPTLRIPLNTQEQWKLFFASEKFGK